LVGSSMTPMVLESAKNNVGFPEYSSPRHTRA